MNYHYLPGFLLLLLCGCAITPVKHRPGTELAGDDLPPVQSGIMPAGDTPPAVVRMRNPVYPLALLRRGVTGVVIIEFIVGPDGKVKDAHAIQSPHEDLSKAAVEAIMDSEYRPATKNGKPTSALMQVPITFAP